MTDLEYYEDEYESEEPELTAVDVANMIGHAVAARASQHEQATAAQVSELSALMADRSLREKYTDWPELAPRVVEMLKEEGYTGYEFSSPAETERTLEFYLRRAADEENERRAFKPTEEWSKVKDAYHGSPWTSL